MIILNCDQHRNLSFVDKKYRILQGEHKFDKIKINMPETIDGVDDMQGVSIKMHFVSGNEHVDRQVVLENDYISTDIDYTLTEKSKRWLLYLAFYVNVDGEVEIGKTNAIAIQVNKLPYSDTLAKEYKEPEIVLIKGDKGDPGEDGKSAYEIAVEHGYEGTEEEWLSEMKDYNELDNKPQINGVTLSGNKTSDGLNLQDKLTAGQNITITEENVISASSGSNDYTDLTNKPSINNVTLSGNKSSDDLDLQDKLTAGENITISDDNVISASGGVTSYNNLTDKPYVTIDDNSGAFPSWAITDGIYFATGEFFGTHTVDGEIDISLDSSVFRYHNKPIPYNFNKFSSAPYNGCLKLQHSFVSNFPSALNRIDTSKPYFLTQHFNTSEFGKRERYAFRKVSGYSRDGDFIEYAQICYINYHSYLDNEIISQTDWVELSGSGSQIVSGVVNANGTITFTDSDGNTFTTSGSNLVTSGNEQIGVGYDNGGFYFLFDDGQGA